MVLIVLKQINIWLNIQFLQIIWHYYDVNVEISDTFGLWTDLIGTDSDTDLIHRPIPATKVQFVDESNCKKKYSTIV